MTRAQARDRLTASRPRTWALFMALLLSPLGAYVYLGRLRRLAAFLGLFALGMLAAGWCVDGAGAPAWVADVAVLAMALGALVDQWWLIGRARARCLAAGLTVERKP